MTDSKLTPSLSFWIAVICTILATTPFELTSENTVFTTLFPFTVMFGLLFHLEARARRYLSNNHLIWAAVLFAALMITNIGTPKQYAIALSVLAPAMILLAGFARQSARILKVIDAAIAINVTFLLIQIFIYLVSGNIIEFHTLLFPFSSSRVAEFIGLVRLGGLHNEPGTYSSYIFALLVSRHLLGGAPSDKIFFISGFSLIITFSAWGMLAGLIVLMAAFLSRGYKNKRSRIVAIIGFTLATAFVLSSSYFDLFANYIDQRFDTSKGSASYRSEVFSVFVDELPTYMLIGRPFAEAFCAHCVSPQDLGVFSQLIVRLGALTGSIFLFAAVRPYLRTSLTTLILVAFFFTGKYDLGDPIFWFVLSLAVSGRKQIETAWRGGRVGATGAPYETGAGQFAIGMPGMAIVGAKTAIEDPREISDRS